MARLIAEFADNGGTEYTTRAAGIKPDSDGTTGDGTDRASALNTWLAARSAGDVVRFSAGTDDGSGYRITGAVSVPVGVHVIQDAPIYYDGTGPEAALTIGAAGTNNNRVALRGLHVVRVTQSDWSSESDVGIRLINPVSCDIEIRRAANFTIPAQIRGDASGAVYNNTRLGQLVNGKVGLDLDAVNVGYVNENNFFGGRFPCFSGVGTNTTRYSVRITSSDASYLTNNNNNFHKPAFEPNDSAAGTGDAIPILVEHGVQNAFLGCRNENGTTGKFHQTQNASRENVYDCGYGVVTGEDTSDHPSSVEQDRRTALLRRGPQVWSSGPMHKRAVFDNGSTFLNIAGVSVANSGDAGVYSAASSVAVASGYLEFSGSRAPAIFIDTRTAKRFVLRRDVEAGYGGRFRIRCYDSSGTVLTSAGGGHPYVKTREAATVAYGSSWGGVYSTGSDSSGDLFVEVGDDVAYICVILTSGSANLRVRSFSVHAVDWMDSSAWTGLNEPIPGANYGSGAPTAGTYVVGQRLFNKAPSAGGTEGWVCTTAGTPGTWKTFGSIAA